MGDSEMKVRFRVNQLPLMKINNNHLKTVRKYILGILIDY